MSRKNEINWGRFAWSGQADGRDWAWEGRLSTCTAEPCPIAKLCQCTQVHFLGY